LAMVLREATISDLLCFLSALTRKSREYSIWITSMSLSTAFKSLDHREQRNVQSTVVVLSARDVFWIFWEFFPRSRQEFCVGNRLNRIGYDELILTLSLTTLVVGNVV
jgi:hypothetical protein